MAPFSYVPELRKQGVAALRVIEPLWVGPTSSPPRRDHGQFPTSVRSIANAITSFPARTLVEELRVY